ncbi:MAG TPA: hypothetical protein VG227_09200 [Caulobacteraceae bacterium]|nr:hypothetical protein [Caulobacteraceae bacterium]
MDRIEIIPTDATKLDQALAQTAAACALQVSAGRKIFRGRQTFRDQQVSNEHVASKHYCTLTFALGKLRTPPERMADPVTRPGEIINTQPELERPGGAARDNSPRIVASCVSTGDVGRHSLSWKLI